MHAIRRANLHESQSVFLLAAGAVFLAPLFGISSVLAPTLALVATGAVVFVAVAFRSLAAVLALFVLLTFFDRATGLQSIGLTTPVKLAGGVLVLAWLFVVLGRGWRAPVLFFEQKAFVVGVVLFIAWAFVSALWAAHPGDAAASAFRLAQGAILLFIVFAAVRTAPHLWWLILSFIAGALFATLVGFFGAYAASESVNNARLSGGFDDPNELAAVIVPALVLSGFAFEALRGRPARLFLLPVAAVLGLGLLRTDSQAGLVSLGVACVLALFFSGPVRDRAVALVAIVVVSATAYYTFVTAPVAFQTITSSENTGARQSLWGVAARVISDHPLLGVGAGNFSDVEQSYALATTNLTRVDVVAEGELIHNSYLQVLAELGPPGLLAFLALIAGSLALGLRAARSFHRAGNRELELLARGILIGTAAILVAYFFATNQYEKQLWLLLAVGPVLDSIAHRFAPADVALGARASGARPRARRTALHRT